MAELKAFTMPKWGIEMAEGTVAEWMVEQGASFTKGTVLTLIETDKITNEIEAEADGCFVRLLAQAGETHAVGALLAILGTPDTPVAEIDAFVAQFRAVDTAMPGLESSVLVAAAAPSLIATSAIPEDTAISLVARSVAQSHGVDVSTIAGSGRKGRITRQDIDLYLRGPTAPVLKGPIDATGQESAFASPLARRLAVQQGVDLAVVKGTGHRGRITKADVLARVPASIPAAAAVAAPVAAKVSGTDEVEIIPMSSMRKAIAARLTQAKQEIPHFYLRRRVRADRLIALRMLQGKVGSLNDYLLRAVALALREVPEVNIQVHGTAIHRFAHADIAVAVSTPRGLITPIVRHADEMDVRAIADRVSELTQRARAGKLAAEEFQGGSFSVSNLGMFGVEQFDAIINPPQGAILAVGKARPEPVDDDGAIRIVPVMHLSLSCDHRAIDGADGARFLEALVALLESPERL